ncbi:MAG: hypothetical protein A2V93_09670 [Ignavibacteria bacterium RBG_16_34_14]|nr:MAG: hypothetical protein A2V93_09670 [Ignavibacteria bacterium RBG_16_34_14]
MDEEKDTYVFDEIPENELENEPTKHDVENRTPKEEIYYLIQLGAFTSKQNAENFAEQCRKKLGREISVSFNDDVNLFVVRLETKFNNRNEAEKVRDELRKEEEFKDAWIISPLK